MRNPIDPLKDSRTEYMPDDPSTKHHGKVKKYFNIAIKKRVDHLTNGVPVSIVALNNNRHHLINHLLTPRVVAPLT